MYEGRNAEGHYQNVHKKLDADHTFLFYTDTI